MTPRYERVAEHIRQQIANGQLQPGDSLPSTRQLVEQHGVSYGTIRTAIMQLKMEGLIAGDPGVRVHVAHDVRPPDRPRPV